MHCFLTSAHYSCIMVVIRIFRRSSHSQDYCIRYTDYAIESTIDIYSSLGIADTSGYCLLRKKKKELTSFRFVVLRRMLASPGGKLAKFASRRPGTSPGDHEEVCVRTAVAALPQEIDPPNLKRYKNRKFPRLLKGKVDVLTRRLHIVRGVRRTSGLARPFVPHQLVL